MYDLYYNKQAPKNITESPETAQGFSGTPFTKEKLIETAAIGYGFAAARIFPAGKQLINTVSKATGNKQIQRAVDAVGNTLAIGVEIATIGLGGTIAVEGTRVVVSSIQGAIQEITDVANQEYNIQKQGVAISKYVGVGERID